MRFLTLLLIAGPLLAQPVRSGDRVVLRHPDGDLAGKPYRGTVVTPGADSAVVDLEPAFCRDERVTRVVAYSHLSVRIAGARHPVRGFIGGAVGGALFGMLLDRMYAERNGGHRAPYRKAAIAGAVFGAPFGAVQGYKEMDTRWVPVLDQPRGARHVPYVERDSPRRCIPDRRPPL